MNINKRFEEKISKNLKNISIFVAHNKLRYKKYV